MPMAVNRLHTAELPAALRDDLTDAWDAFVAAASEARLPIPSNPDFTASMLRVWASSDFVSGICIDNPAVLYGLLESGDLLADYSAGTYTRKLKRSLKGASDAAQLGRRLREFREQSARDMHAARVGEGYRHRCGAGRSAECSAKTGTVVRCRVWPSG